MSSTKHGGLSRALIVAVLAASSVAAPVAAQGARGWTFAMKMSVDSGAGAPVTATTMRQRHVPGRIRMDFSTPSFVGTKMDGMYTIVTDADTSMTSVVPGMKMATIMNMGGMMMDMDMPHPKSGAEHLVTDSLEDLGDTEAILGQPTHHYRETRVGTLDIALGSQMCVQHFNTVTEVWLSTDPELAAALAMDKSAVGDSPFESFAPDLSISTSKMPKGTALRTILASTTRAGSAAPRTVTTQIDVTELSHSEIPDSLFTVPADYNSIDMRKMMADMPPHMMDSAMQTGMQNEAALLMKTLCGS